MCKKKCITKEEFDSKMTVHFDAVSKKTRNLTISVIRKYENFHESNIVELIDEALYEQRKGVTEDQVAIYDKLLDFRTFLLKEKSYGTTSTYMTVIKKIYKLFRVTLPQLPTPNSKVANHSDPITFDDIITLDEIKEAFEIVEPSVKVRCMAMVTGGYSFNETQHMTIRQFIDDLYPAHQSNDDEEALLFLSKQDNLVWQTQLVREKTKKPYYGFVNPETTQSISKWLLTTNYQDKERLFALVYNTFDIKMTKANDSLGFKEAGGMKKFRAHMLRKYNATHLKGNILSEDHLSNFEIDELQGRGKTSIQDTYIKSNPVEQFHIYLKAMNNVSIYNTYKYQIRSNGGAIIKCENNKTKVMKKVKKYDKMIRNDGLQEYINTVGVESFIEQVNQLAK